MCVAVVYPGSQPEPDPGYLRRSLQLTIELRVTKEKDMNTKTAPTSEKTFACETCQMRRKAEANPKTLMARLWRWHTRWCPGWKSYQAHLAGQGSSGTTL
jgi:hypothetical protein